MSEPRVMLATLCLNELEWLPRLWAQHRDWPGLVNWTFVEGADEEYAKANPSMVSFDGLSRDGTTAFLSGLRDDRVVTVHPGLARVGDAAQNKVLLRDAYLRVAADVKPDVIVVIDADEFYTKADQARIPSLMMGYPDSDSFIFHRREIWWPPSLREQRCPMMRWEVKGGFWDIPCCHWWRWRPGMLYKTNHNTPEVDGRALTARCKRFDHKPGMPQMVHMGFAAARREREAKNRYYASRGEATDPRRSWYVESRAAWERWIPGGPLPRGARVVEYSGPVPECFKENGDANDS